MAQNCQVDSMTTNLEMCGLLGVTLGDCVKMLAEGLENECGEEHIFYSCAATNTSKADSIHDYQVYNGRYNTYAICGKADRLGAVDKKHLDTICAAAYTHCSDDVECLSGCIRLETQCLDSKLEFSLLFMNEMRNDNQFRLPMR